MLLVTKVTSLADSVVYHAQQLAMLRALGEWHVVYML